MAFNLSWGEERLSCHRVVLRALDKITAHVSDISLKLQETAIFGDLSITLHKCWTNKPEDPFEVLAYLSIYERKKGKDTLCLFKGWMSAAHPALSALEHPIYDVWVKETPYDTQASLSEPLKKNNEPLEEAEVIGD